jgi:lipoprotein signal peptidase
MTAPPTRLTQLALFSTLTALMVGGDCVATRTLPEVHLNPASHFGIAPFVLALALPLWLAVLPRFPGRTIRVGFALILAGGTSNLLLISYLGGAPDFLVFRNGIAVGDLASWERGVAFFNFGDLALWVGVALLLPGLLATRQALNRRAFLQPV